MALKKNSSNVKIFEEIQKALKKEFQAREMERWFKREWKHIQNKIKFGSELSWRETDTESESIRWCDILNPVFTEGVDEFTGVACSASDVAGESSISSAISVHASSGEMVHPSSDESCDEERSRTPVSVPEGDNKFEDHHGSATTKFVEDESNEGKMEKKLKVAKKSKMGLHPKRDIKPKTQTAAVLQLWNTMENYSQSMNKAQDDRLNRIMEADQKHDEVFLKFHQEQVEANRRHEELMMQLVLQKAPSQSLPQQYYPFQEWRPHSPSLLVFTSEHHTSLLRASMVYMVRLWRLIPQVTIPQ